MTTIYDVAYYILEKKPEITTMKLQKLCYYAQSWSLAWDEKPLFGEDFQAWANGPVCYELYNLHRGKFKVDKEVLSEHITSDTPFAEEELETIDIILDDYGQKEPHYLSELTHKERPWKETRGSLPLGVSSENIIPKELMQEYYTGLLV